MNIQVIVDGWRAETGVNQEITSEVIELVGKAYDEMRTPTDIAKKFKLSLDKVKQAIKESGREIRKGTNNKIKESVRLEVLRLDKELNSSQIAKRLKISLASVNNIKKEDRGCRLC